MNHYKVKYITAGNGYFPHEFEETVSANDFEEAMMKVKKYCFNNYMTCEFISIVKEEE